MKKTLNLLLSMLFMLSCSSGDNDVIPKEAEIPSNPNTEKKLVLDSYTLTYKSGNVVIHEFNNNTAVDVTKNGTLATKYEYDDKGRISKYVKYNEDENKINKSYTFSYGANNEITSILEEEPLQIYGITSYSREINYIGKSIQSKLPSGPESFYNLEFILNDQGLITEFTQHESDGKLYAKLIFSYDINKNCTSVKQIALDFNGNETEYVFKYIHDDKNNPVYSFFDKNYLASLFIYGREEGFGFPLKTIVRTFGKNNCKNTEYPAIYPVSSQFYFEYEYNIDNYPTKAWVKNKESNDISYTTDFLYH